MNTHSFGPRSCRSLVSAPTRYAILALVHLGDDGGYRLAKDLSQELGLPGPYLAKILQILGMAHILESMRGPNGGFRLRRPAHRITIQDVITAMEGGALLEGGLLGEELWESEADRPLLPGWERIHVQLQQLLDTTTIRDLQLAIHEHVDNNVVTKSRTEKPN